MQADMPDLVHVHFTGEMVNKLIEIDKEMYEPYVLIEQGERVLYLELLKQLYGTVKAAQLFWERLAKHLVTDWGFTLNPYDQCVANKMINGSQCTIVWHMDDLKISYVQEEVVNNIVKWLNKEFGSGDPMMVFEGKIHHYLGLTLDYTTPGMLKVDMTGYVDGVLEEVPQDMMGTTNAPAASYLFKMNQTDPTLLGPSKKEIFHHITMQLAYLAQWGCPDIHTAITF